MSGKSSSRSSSQTRRARLSCNRADSVLPSSGTSIVLNDIWLTSVVWIVARSRKNCGASTSRRAGPKFVPSPITAPALVFFGRVTPGMKLYMSAGSVNHFASASSQKTFGTAIIPSNNCRSSASRSLLVVFDASAGSMRMTSCCSDGPLRESVQVRSKDIWIFEAPPVSHRRPEIANSPSITSPSIFRRRSLISSSVRCRCGGPARRFIFRRSSLSDSASTGNRRRRSAMNSGVGLSRTSSRKGRAATAASAGTFQLISLGGQYSVEVGESEQLAMSAVADHLTALVAHQRLERGNGWVEGPQRTRSDRRTKQLIAAPFSVHDGYLVAPGEHAFARRLHAGFYHWRHFPV